MRSLDEATVNYYQVFGRMVGASFLRILTASGPRFIEILKFETVFLGLQPKRCLGYIAKTACSSSVIAIADCLFVIALLNHRAECC
jgi:hypothetical protein